MQGTINGLGERCGNTNLISLIPTLVLKTNYSTTIDKEKLKSITKVILLNYQIKRKLMLELLWGQLEEFQTC